MNSGKQLLRNALILLSIFSIVGISACTKKTDTPSTPSTAPTAPHPADGFGALAAVKTKVSQNVPGYGTIDIDLGVGVAAFGSSSANFFAGTYVDAGAITCNTKALDKQTGNAYLSSMSTSGFSGSSLGIDFGSNINWNVAGSADVPAISKTLTNAFPTFPEITSASTITKSSGYTLTNNSISGADSILYVIASGSASVKKTLVGSATSCTFTASELSALSNSDNALIQVNAYNIQSDIFSGKKYYFVNQCSANKLSAKVQ
jgi:hypothetical protein